MNFSPPLQPGRLLRRYKRFLADVELPDGTTTTMHCPNTGSMKNCQPYGGRLWYSSSDNKKRKYAHTWEVIEVPAYNDELCRAATDGDQYLVGINTGRANPLVEEALLANQIPQFSGFHSLRREVPYGSRRSRIDILLQYSAASEVPQLCYIEVKSVSLGLSEGRGQFPDAVTARGQKHLQELMEICSQGHRAALIFCVQHSGISWLEPADSIDPEYGRLLRQAISRGVEVIALSSKYTQNELGEIESLTIDGELPIRL